MTPEEIKFEGPRTNVQIIEEEEQITSNDLLEEERMKAFKNLEKYQKNKELIQQESKAKATFTKRLCPEKKKKRRYSRKVSTKNGRSLSHHKNK